MKYRDGLRPFTGLVGAMWLLAAASCSARHGTAQDAKASNDAIAANASPPAASAPAVEATAVATAASSLDALPPPETETSTTALRSLTLSDSRGTVEPSLRIPSPAAKVDNSSHAGVDAAIKAVPSTVPVGTLSKSALEGPLRDRARFDHCRIPYATHGEIAAVVYDGAALGVDVKTNPSDRALNMCIERTVRQMTWVKETAVNKVKVAF